MESFTLGIGEKFKQAFTLEKCDENGGQAGEGRQNFIQEIWSTSLKELGTTRKSALQALESTSCAKCIDNSDCRDFKKCQSMDMTLKPDEQDPYGNTGREHEDHHIIKDCESLVGEEKTMYESQCISKGI